MDMMTGLQQFVLVLVAALCSGLSVMLWIAIPLMIKDVAAFVKSIKDVTDVDERDARQHNTFIAARSSTCNSTLPRSTARDSDTVQPASSWSPSTATSETCAGNVSMMMQLISDVPYATHLRETLHAGMLLRKCAMQRANFS